MTYSYGQPDTGSQKMVFSNGRANSAIFVWKAPLATSLDFVKHSLTQWAEIVPRVATLAERGLYEQGKWPSNIGYPIER